MPLRPVCVISNACVIFFDKIKHLRVGLNFLCKNNLMNNIIFYLASCDTCRKIIKQLPNQQRLKFQDIRQDPITAGQFDELRSMAGSYEALFSRKAQLYKSMDLKNKVLSEDDIRDLLLQHYTFLSRPVIVVDGKIYIGNSQKVVQQAILALQ
jgi:arsenate reductase